MRQNEIFETWLGKKTELYQKRCPNSEAYNKKARSFLPGGDTRTATYHRPYPIYVKEAKGCRLTDVDGNEYIDFMNNYTVLTLGHCHPSVVKAIREQAGMGISFSSPTQNQTDLARILCQRVDSMDFVRFCNSGTEATMNAIRAARIWTGKSKVVKMEGGYHGTHDVVEVSFNPGPGDWGPADSPRSVPQNKGIPKSVVDEVIVIPFNNGEAARKVIRENAQSIACVIVEPMMGGAGCICQKDDYLQTLREITRENGILLIFDEIVTLRLDYHAMQGLYSVTPDLTTFGKMIGGGLAVGAFGGAGEIMDMFSPLNPGHVLHSGTFNGNPVTMAAGSATMEEMTPEIYGHLNALGEMLKQDLNRVFAKLGIQGTVTGYGSLSCIHFNPDEIVDYRSGANDNMMAMELLHLELMERGVYVPPRGGELAISAPMTQKEITAFVQAFEDALIRLTPFLEQATPRLLAG